MYDELVKRLRNAAQWADKGLVITPSVCLEAADAIEKMSMRLHGDEAAIAGMKREIESMVVSGKKPRWIPVSERLPEEDGCYLVAVKNDHQRKYSKTAWFSHGSWFARQDVTHWMPLPQPPKEET